MNLNENNLTGKTRKCRHFTKFLILLKQVVPMFFSNKCGDMLNGIHIRGYTREAPDPATSWAPWRIYNIGNHRLVELMTYIETLERALGREAQKNFLPLQDGDVLATYADTADLRALTGFRPATSIEVGIGGFVDWYRTYYGV
jgi:nucleoside-diphosphate-sugar epimerase